MSSISPEGCVMVLYIILVISEIQVLIFIGKSGMQVQNY